MAELGSWEERLGALRWQGCIDLSNVIINFGYIDTTPEDVAETFNSWSTDKTFAPVGAPQTMMARMFADQPNIYGYPAPLNMEGAN